MPSYNVKIGEVFVSKEKGILKCILGSCVAVIMYDGKNKVGGISHILLPFSKKINSEGDNFKFANKAVQKLYDEMLKNGGERNNIVAYIYGGAVMFENYKSKLLADIGSKNIEFAENELKKLEIPYFIKDVGGNYGRRIEFDLNSGKITVKKYTKKQSEI
jgi:chemotaxis protein CheD